MAYRRGHYRSGHFRRNRYGGYSYVRGTYVSGHSFDKRGNAGNGGGHYKRLNGIDSVGENENLFPIYCFLFILFCIAVICLITLGISGPSGLAGLSVLVLIVDVILIYHTMMYIKKSNEKKSVDGNEPQDYSFKTLSVSEINVIKCAGDGWVCSDCGKWNADYVFSCGCGSKKENAVVKEVVSSEDKAKKERDDYILSHGGWRCPRCGDLNQNYKSMCRCRMKRSDVLQM